MGTSFVTQTASELIDKKISSIFSVYNISSATADRYKSQATILTEPCFTCRSFVANTSNNEIGDGVPEGTPVTGSSEVLTTNDSSK